MDQPPCSDKPCTSNALVVGIGASAGGLKALESLFHQISSRLGASYVVIQHLSPDFKSLMAELLARHTELAISMIEDGASIQANHIYLIPPRKAVLIEKQTFRLKDAEGSPALPVDIFFKSLAEELGKKAVGIVLSGTGSDGTEGSKRIKEVGGKILVQDPDSAEFDGMPQSVILSGAYDEILQPEQMAAWLNKTSRARSPSETISNPIARFAEPIERIGTSLKRAYGLDISNYKASTVDRRIKRRIDMVGDDTIESYSERIEHDSKELDLLYRDLLIGVSSFYRDPKVWKYLEAKTIPSLFNNATTREFRAWVAGCATGEEVYTLAILIIEHAAKIDYKGSIHIFATDLHQGSLAFASEGIYSADAVSSIPLELRKKYFIAERGSFRVSPQLRSKVVFASHNLIGDPPFTRIDLATCRNLLIYLEPRAQDRAVAMLLFGLRIGGSLVLGASENIRAEAFGTSAKEPQLKVFEKTRQVSISDLPAVPSAHAGRPFKQPAQHKRSITLDAQLLDDYDRILSKKLGDGFIIGEQHQVLQYIGDPNPYLKPVSGRASPSILSQLSGDLNLALSTCLQRVNTNGSAFTIHGVRYSSEEEDPLVDVHVEPLFSDHGERHYHVSIKKIRSDSKKGANEQSRSLLTEAEYESKGARARRIAELELELQASRENLQAAIEQSQMSTEELQASNEELLAANEELQSTNEELHSVNEELFSVNSEFEEKNIELHSLNQDYDSLLSSLVNIGILYLDGELRVKKFNKAVTSVFKLVKEDIGRPIEHIAYNLGNQKKFLRRVSIVQEENKQVSFEAQSPDGAFLMIRIFPHNDQNEYDDGVILTFTDITEIKLAQSKLETAVSISQIVWWDWDIELDALNTYCHDQRGFNCILGYTASTIPKSHTGWLEATHPEDLDRVKDSLNAHLAGKTNHWTSEHRYRNPEGNWVWVRDSGEVVLRDEEGAPLKMVGTTQNIDSRKKLEIQLRRNAEEKELLLARAEENSRNLKALAEKAEAANRTKSQFLAMMSHEIRTPLNAIIGYSDLLMNLEISEELRENLEPISMAGQSLMSIIGDILDFSKLESHSLELEHGAFSLQDLLRQAIGSVAEKAGVEKTCQLLDSGLRPYKKPLWLLGDSCRICQILVNLVSNAVKFTSQGNVQLTAQIRSLKSGQAKINFSVMDDGIGIESEQLENIFEPFTQGDSSINRKYGGTGLGLSISQRLAHAMGSEITVESEIGLGSVFSFELQFTVYDTEKSFEEIERKIPAEPKELQALIVEDNESNSNLLSKMLNSLGVSSDVAENGQTGIELLYSKEYDIVFMDLSMKKLDGISATRTIRALDDQRFKKVPIIAITANVSVETRAECEEVGMNDFISKPATLSKVKSVLNAHFRLGEPV